MTNELEKGKDTIQRICETLRKSTVEPAIREAEAILQKAQEEAEAIISQAKEKASEIVSQAKNEIEKNQTIFFSTLSLAAKQTLELLKQEIETNLFHLSSDEVVKQYNSQPHLIAELLKAMINAVESEGIKTDFTIVIGKTIPQDEMNQLLGDICRQKLREHSVLIGDFETGAQLKVHNKSMMLDISDNALKELMQRYMKKDFRKYLFAS